MKYYISSGCDSLTVFKKDNNKFYRAVGWSNDTYSFEEVPYIPQNAVLMENIKSNPTSKPFKDKKHFHNKMKIVLKTLNFSDCKLRTELDLSNSIVFVVISDSLSQDRFENTQKIKQEYEKDITDEKKFGDYYQIQLVSREEWESRSY